MTANFTYDTHDSGFDDLLVQAKEEAIKLIKLIKDNSRLYSAEHTGECVESLNNVITIVDDYFSECDEICKNTSNSAQLIYIV